MGFVGDIFKGIFSTGSPTTFLQAPAAVPPPPPPPAPPPAPPAAPPPPAAATTPSAQGAQAAARAAAAAAAGMGFSDTLRSGPQGVAPGTTSAPKLTLGGER